MLLVPIVSFILLVFYLYQAKAKRLQEKPISNFNRINLIRSIQISAFAGLMLGVAPIFYILYSDQFGLSVMVTIFYFVTLHAGFVLIGMLNLARAMAKKLPLF